MVVYENKDYVVSQCKSNKHIMILKKTDDEPVLVCHINSSTEKPMLSQKAGKRLLDMILNMEL